MRCKSCGSQNLSKFSGEIAIHSAGLKIIEEPFVWVFSEVMVCLDCRAAQFVVPEAEWRILTKRDPDVLKSPVGVLPMRRKFISRLLHRADEPLTRSQMQG